MPVHEAFENVFIVNRGGEDRSVGPELNLVPVVSDADFPDSVLRDTGRVFLLECLPSRRTVTCSLVLVRSQ